MIKKLFPLFLLALIASSCSKNDSGSGVQTFRQLHNNTSWISANQLGTLTIKTDKLFYLAESSGCYYYKVGTYNNIYSSNNNCTYYTVTNSVVQDDYNKYIIKQAVSSGASGGTSGCSAYDAFLTFQLKDPNTLLFITDENGIIDTVVLTKTNLVATQGCIDATPIGGLWQ
jgi:hypothetical protein